MKKYFSKINLILLVVVGVSLPVLASAPVIFAQNANAQSYAQTNRAEEVVARIQAKLDHRLSMYREFLEKVQVKRNALAQSSDVSELDRLIRVSETAFTTTRNKLTAFVNTTSQLPEVNSTGENMSLILSGVRDVRQSFNELHTSVRNVTREIARISN